MVLRAYMLLFLHTFCPGEKCDFLNCLRKIGCLPAQTTDFIHTFCPIALICAQDGVIRLGNALRVQGQHQIDV